MLLKNIILNYFLAICTVFGFLSLSTEVSLGSGKSRKTVHHTGSLKKLRTPFKSKKPIHQKDDEDVMDLPKYEGKKTYNDNPLPAHSTKRAKYSPQSKKPRRNTRLKGTKSPSEPNVSDAAQAFEIAFLEIINNVELTAKELGFHPNDMAIIFESVKPLLKMVKAYENDRSNQKLRAAIERSPY